MASLATKNMNPRNLAFIAFFAFVGYTTLRFAENFSFEVAAIFAVSFFFMFCVYALDSRQKKQQENWRL